VSWGVSCRGKCVGTDTTRPYPDIRHPIKGRAVKSQNLSYEQTRRIAMFWSQPRLHGIGAKVLT
jgi:hypothetical protein